MQVSFPLSKIKHEQNKNFKNGQSISDLWDHFKRPNIGIGVPRREQIRAGEKKKRSIIVGSFPNMMKTMDLRGLMNLQAKYT